MDLQNMEAKILTTLYTVYIFFDGNAITQFLYMRNYYSDCHTTKNGILTALKCGFWLQLTFYRGIFIVKLINYSI